MPSLLPLLLHALLRPALAQDTPPAPDAAVDAPADPTAIDADTPAAEPEEGGSIWNFIESADGSPPTPAVLEATEELVEERTAELTNVGSVGAEPPVEYYLDPVGATSLDPLHIDKVDPKEFDIPVVVNDDVKRWMEYFLGRGRKYYARYLERSTQWIPMMHREAEARGLPDDLVYLSMIESGFSTGATSYVAAAGLWQFMTYTGRDYGLRIDWWVDERRDPLIATDAALHYLGDLNKMFNGDWWLSWASYNGGQGRVLAATRHYGTTDFWKIAEGDYLASETENYVPKLIAAAIIGKHPERYGFVGLHYLPEWKFDTVEVPASSSVSVLARCAGMTEDAFLTFNPSLRRFALPPDPPLQTVRIAANRTVAFKEAFAKVPPEERLTLERHVVKRGESLGSIARKYGVSTEELAKINRLSNANHVNVGMEIVVPTNGKSLAEVADAGTDAKPAPKPASTTPVSTAPVSNTARTSTASTTAAKPAASTPAVVYTVRSGDSLGNLAKKYHTSISQLQAWNKMKGTTIKVGQRLIVKPASSAPASSAPASSAPASSAPAATASTKASSSSAASKASPAPSAGKTTTYTVRRGDTLSTIADRYNCSVSDIKSWNGMKGSTIYPGQKLKIKG